MKKFVSLLISCLLVCVCFATAVFAEGESSAEVYVSIADKGALAVAYEKVTVTDIDDDGKLTVNDTFYAVHEAKFDGGAKEGYSYYSTEQYGLSIGTLWGDKSGCFGYYINNASAWSLADEVKNGDCVYGFVYSDTTSWSDSYTFFDKNSVSVDIQGEITLTLSKSGYDADWNPITVAATGAVITVDGVDTGIKTDENGKATIKITESGTHTISAKCESEIIVPPVCTASVKKAETSTESNTESSAESNSDASTESSAEPNPESNTTQPGDNSSMLIFVIIAAVAAVAAIAVLTVSFKIRNNEF